MNDEKFAQDAKERAQGDLEQIRQIRKESRVVSIELRKQVAQNHWAETVKKAMEGS